MTTFQRNGSQILDETFLDLKLEGSYLAFEKMYVHFKEAEKKLTMTSFL